MELHLCVPPYILKIRDIENAIQMAFAESDEWRNTRFDIFKPRGREKALLTVPSEGAGQFLISAGKWGRICVGRTELKPLNSKKRPNANVVKALLHAQPVVHESAGNTKSNDEIRDLLQMIDWDVDGWSDNDEIASLAAMSSAAESNSSRWTSNMPDVDSDDDDLDVSVPMREAWFGVWCDNETTKHIAEVKPQPQSTSTLLPMANNVGFVSFNILAPNERGSPTFSPEWKASQIVGMNSFDHPFFEVDKDIFKLKLSADVQIQFFEYIHQDIKSVVLQHTSKESVIYITLAHAPVIADTSETTTCSYTEISKIKFSRLYQVNPKHSWFVFNSLVCQIKFHPSRTDKVASIFSRVSRSVQSPVLIAPGGLYHRKYQETLKKMFRSVPIKIAYQLSIIQTWSIMFPVELVEFFKASIMPLILSHTDDEISDLLIQLVRRANWEPFKGESRPNFNKLFSEIVAEHKFTVVDYDRNRYCMKYQLYVTPTGMYLEGPYLDKSNRVVRQYKNYSDNFLHVSFVEEDGSHIGHNSLCDIPHNIIYEDRFCGFLKDGIKIAGRLFKFLAFSNMSLKEGRVLFFMEPEDGSVTVNSIRTWMGDFSMIKSPARYAARMGQAFSSTSSTVTISPQEVQMNMPDIVRNGYLFSDGIGSVSPLLAKQMWEKLKSIKNISQNKKKSENTLDIIPSAFQIRFGGAKGMVSIDPSLTGRKMIIRKSMVKFHSPNCMTIEVADDSSICRDAYLNRQIILILEDLGVPKQVFLELQRKFVRELAGIWSSPKKLIKLAGIDGVFGNSVQLWENLGIPDWFANKFVRHAFDHIRAYKLKEIKYRARLQIPGGWTLFGVLDETGTLKEGQVYVQLLSPEVSKVLTGPCIIYRSPVIHPGDVQPVIAVNVPELQHMRNVIVFSQFGNRDLPSKLGGGDLDGDMFSIVSNHDFFPKRNNFKQAAAYTAVSPLELESPVTIDDIADFVVYFIQHDKLGMISKRHLALADQLPGGSTHPDCLLLSELCNHAVDFAKSGIPADIKKAPKLKSRPDFMYKPNQPVKTGYYQSPRVQGLMYRDDELNYLLEKSCSYNDTLFTEMYKSPDLDPIWKFIKLKYIKWESFVDEAIKFQVSFEAELDRIACFCRPKLTEIELWTGFINGEGRKHQRQQFNLEEWAREQFALLLKKTEIAMTKGKVGMDAIGGLSIASYYVSNIVKPVNSAKFGKVAIVDRKKSPINMPY
ncbi:hypothetical protein HK100_012326 [Physocladia obscura]|uniref:RNA-dependent RNA polymerase n=1 Tax=Physocladia obscura TaxID=109957 RepID=A0AAD5T5Z0_9FUNG|nr:hypothetical protein HK100_012326 [Physocladia obscura]